MDDIQVIADKVSKLTDSIPKRMCGVNDDCVVFVYYSPSWGCHACIGTVYFSEGMSTVYKRKKFHDNSVLYGDKEVGSVAYADPKFFEKVADLIRGL